MKATTAQTQLRPVSRRHQVHILNPAAGGGKVLEAAKRAIENTGGEMRFSEKPGQITEIVRDLFIAEPEAHAVVYGGDGTVYETVNGIMQSGKNATASFSVIPAGSGNDFSAQANDSGQLEKSVLTPIDLIRTTVDGETRYFANMMNIGFDCSVVYETYTLKKYPFLKGSAAYIAGVAKVLAKKKTTDAEITLSGCVRSENLTIPGGEEIGDIHYQKKILLTACANGVYCGGGFRALPYSSLTDGFMDVLVVNDVSRAKFIALVGDYRAGTYLGEDGEVKEKFKSVVDFIRCRRMTIRGMERVCLDGEVFETGTDQTLEAEVLPGAVLYASV